MHIRATCLLLCGLLLFAPGAGAQAPAETPTDTPSAAPPKRAPKPPKANNAATSATANSEAEEDARQAPPPPVTLPPKSKGGDAITLNDGTVIDGVQIIKESPKEMVLQIISGVELTIPRAQVKSVKRDDISALDAKRGAAAATQPQSSGLLPGMKFSGKLSADISKPPAEFKDEELSVVLTELCKRAGVEVVLDPSVEQLPEADRRWTYQLDAEAPMTLFNLLKDELPKEFPTLEALLLKDQIVVATKEAVETLKSQGAVEIPGPNAPPPAPGASAAPPAPSAAEAAAPPPATPPAPATPAAPAAPKS